MDFPINLTVGQTQTLNCQGQYLYYESGTAGGLDASIKIKADNDSEVTLKPGQGFRCSREFQCLYVSNARGQSGILGVLIVERGEFFDNRVVGSVEVIDGGKARTLNGSAFMATTGRSAAAASYAVLQLFNPVGSAKNLIIESLSLNTDVDNLIVVCDSVASIGGGPVAPTSKKFGGVASVGGLYAQSMGGMPGGARIHQDYISAKKPLQIWYKEPLVIVPGSGLVIAATITVSITTLYADIEYYEESNA